MCYVDKLLYLLMSFVSIFLIMCNLVTTRSLFASTGPEVPIIHYIDITEILTHVQGVLIFILLFS